MNGIKLICINRKARYLYEILETLEAGIVLIGSEVKSVHAGKINFKDGYVDLQYGEIFLVNMHIAVYNNAGYSSYEPERKRKLLLHKYEIIRLAAVIAQKRFTVVPLKVYFRADKIKIEIGIVRGKKIYNRRDTLKERDQLREMERSFCQLS